MPVARREICKGLIITGALLPGIGRTAGSEKVSLVVPQDGGAPRDPARLVRLGAAEFRILAHAVEGSSAIKTAVMRVDLIVQNTGEPREVTLQFDLSADGTRTQESAETLRRDYIYIQAPGQPWRRVDGSCRGWMCTVRIPAVSGTTKIGLLPWYTYSDYLQFIGSLPKDPHLRKVRLGLSDGGRYHWELRVTDSSVPPERKRRIFWHAREHAFETFSSFSMEGLLDFLLSPAAAEARRQFEFVIHPMTNIDGVAQGYEYRAGYDVPEPRSTATGRLTLGAIDRVRPEFVVSWHNWIAPRDANTLFYTDSEDGQPSRRGWDLFTQRFPSPRSVGHHWQEESDPLRTNQVNHKLEELQEYAMKQYGSRKWGWEMSWWGRDKGDPARNARRAGGDYGRAFVETIWRLDHPPATPPEAPAIEVLLSQGHEFEMSGQAHVANVAQEAFLVGEFTPPSGKNRVVEGLYAGGEKWRLRFVPDEEGEWQYQLRGEGVELYRRGRMLCKP